MTLTSAEAAEIAGVSDGVLRKWVLRGDLEPVRRGAKPLRFDYDAVAECQRKKRGKTWEARHGEAVKAFASAIEESVER